MKTTNFETKKIDFNEVLDETIDLSEGKGNKHYYDVFDKVIIGIVVFGLIAFVYFIISFFLPKHIEIESTRIKVYNEKLENKKLYLQEAKVLLKKYRENEACLEANSIKGTLSDCLSLSLN